jgi:hypothetical protein
MKTTFSNLWADLREKRLTPVAVLLLAGLIAVPVVLKKSPEQPPPAEPVAAKQQSAPETEQLRGLASVKLEETEMADGSSLDTFDPANPFRPPERIVEDAEEQLGDDGSQPDDVTLSEELVESGSGTGETGSGGGDTGSGGGDTGGDTGGDAGDGDSTRTETTEYTYVLDVTFNNNGRKRTIKGLEKLDMLPSTASPLLLFLGVSANAGNAVFLVDSTLETAGEGRCEPSTVECAFLHLGAGSEHMFTNADGDSYRLRIDQIRKVKVDSDASDAATAKGAKRPSAAVAAPKAKRRFTSPLISDLLSVSSTTVDNSAGLGARR